MDVIFGILNFVWDTYIVLCIMFTSLILFCMLMRYHMTGTIFNTDTLNKSKTKAQDLFPKDVITEGNALLKIKLVTVEKVDNMFMMYDSVNDTFMSQGSTRAELWASAKLRYPMLELISVDSTA